MIHKPLPRQRCINYKEIERPYFYNIETKLCSDLGLTVSELHKTAIRKLYTDREVLEMV